MSSLFHGAFFSKDLEKYVFFGWNVNHWLEAELCTILTRRWPLSVKNLWTSSSDDPFTLTLVMHTTGRNITMRCLMLGLDCGTFMCITASLELNWYSYYQSSKGEKVSSLIKYSESFPFFDGRSRSHFNWWRSLLLPKCINRIWLLGDYLLSEKSQC